MKLMVDIPDNLAAQARDLASREHISLDLIISSALTAQLDKTPSGPSIAERAQRVNWKKVDEILARIPVNAPLAGDEL